MSNDFLGNLTPGSSTPRRSSAPAEYLQLERAAAYKSEYINGQIVAMNGASVEHNSIGGDFFGELRQQLRGRPCRAFTNDMRVKVLATGQAAASDDVPPAQG